MDKAEEKLFSTLEKILKRLNLSIEELPENREQWGEFIARINRCFLNFEQERYLLERAMEISSKEMLDLNYSFEHAQSIAHIGSWFFDREKDCQFWSKETYRIFGLEESGGAPNYKEVISLIHEEDRENLEKLLKIAFANKQAYETEFRVFNAKTKEYRWVYVRGYPETDNVETPSFSGIIMDINRQKKTAIEINLMQQQLLITARQAGMSEIATYVLHNMGNILNSVNVSITMIQEKLKRSSVSTLSSIHQMLKEHSNDLAEYLASDEKGKLVIPYIDSLTKELINDHEIIVNEFESLNTNITHMKDIILMQKDISGVLGVTEIVALSDVVDVAIQMSGILQENQIHLQKDYDGQIRIEIEKAKLLQILVNLITNAKDAVLTSNNKAKVVIVTIKKRDSVVEVAVKDNGVGVAKDNFTKIFSFGFTTKAHGHGFGLHSCAITAKELGGEIKVKSEGLETGATFILELPLTLQNRREPVL